MNPAKVTKSAPAIPPTIPPIFLPGDNAELEPTVECALPLEAAVVFAVLEMSRITRIGYMGGTLKERGRCLVICVTAIS